MRYQVEFLDHDAFEALPYPDMETSLGVADPKTMKAFVRKTGIKSVDLFNAAHELEHLQDGHEGVHADHYKNGLYYKDLGSAFKTISSPIDWLMSASIHNPVAQNLFPGLTTKNDRKNQESALSNQTNGQNSVMGQFQNASQGSAPQSSQPNVIQTGAGSSGAGGGPSGNGLGQIQNELYGNYSGR